jgi:hypothetical protein
MEQKAFRLSRYWRSGLERAQPIAMRCLSAARFTPSVFSVEESHREEGGSTK